MQPTPFRQVLGKKMEKKNHVEWTAFLSCSKVEANMIQLTTKVNYSLDEMPYLYQARQNHITGVIFQSKIFITQRVNVVGID